jgi:hypothetical protein
VNIYDPADSIVYVHPTGTAVDRAPAPSDTPGCHQLPDGYANQSPRTHLREGRTARAGRGDIAGPFRRPASSAR